MMDLDSAIQHCKEQVQEQAKRGCYRYAEEHQQLAEWLKELKEYKEQRGERMNEAEKERLIKKDIASIENRVRHAFNQGYEMGLKESRSEIPNTCGDAISRQAVLDIIAFEDKWLFDAKEHNVDTKMAFWAIKSKISELTSVTPQQRTGRWIFADEQNEEDVTNDNYRFICSECQCSDIHAKGTTVPYCWKCGAKMEVEE